jgi:hypothetical protein
MAKKKIGLLGLSNTTLLLIGGGVALYFLTRKKTEPVQGIGAIDEKKVDLVINTIFKDKYIYKKLVNLYLPKIKNMIDNGTYTDKAGYVIVEKFLKWFYTEYYRQYRRGGDYELSKEDKRYVITYLLDFLLDEFTNYEG